jgi:deoxyribonuclease V
MVPPGAVHVAADVHYPASGGARAAAVIAEDERFTTIVRTEVVELSSVAPYRPGHFFERELPALLAVLRLVPEAGVVVVDGYVDLDPSGRPGLGAYVHEQLGVPVIGVAKTAYLAATHAVPVRRGGSSKPLYVTAAGVQLPVAAALVVLMAGPHRMPTALHLADALGRGVAAPVVG